MSTATKSIRPSYVPTGDRVDRMRHEIDEVIGRKLYDSIRGELPKLLLLSKPDFCRVLMQRHDAIYDVPEHKRFDTDVADELVVRAALSNAGIVETFSTAIGNQMQVAFDAEPDTTLDWTLEVPAVNFLPAQVFTLEHEARLERHTKGRMAEHASFGTKGQSWGINRYSDQFILDEQQMLDGQHVGAVLLAASQFIAAAARVRADLVYSLLLNNPTLEADNLVLFHSSHGNYATGGGSAFSATSLDTGISAIGLQHLTDQQGDPIHQHLEAGYLIVPPQLVGAARRAVRNMVLGDDDDLDVRQESRLSAIGIVNPKSDTIVSGSATNWLLTAAATSRPSIVVGGLNGNLLPQVRRFDLDRGQWGMGWDVNLNIGAAAVDYRGVYFAAGA